MWFLIWHEKFCEFLPKHSKVWKFRFDGQFFSKVFQLKKYRWVIFYDTEQWYNVSAKKFHRNYVLWDWRVMHDIKTNWLVAWKITKGIWLIFTKAFERLQICTFMGPFCPKHTNFYMKKVQNSYVLWHGRAMQSLKKTWSLVPKMAWEIWCILMRGVASLKTCTPMCYFCQKYIMFKPKKYRRVMYHNTEEWCKIWGRTDLCFEKRYEEFDKFWPNTQKSWSLHFNEFLLTKLYNAWTKTLQGSFVLWHIRVMCW